jgi:hypothetical protein
MSQQGTVFERSGSWYLQYWRSAFENGQTVRKRITKKLVRRSDEFRSKKDVLIGCARRINEILEPVNERREQPEGAMTLTDFTEERFFKHIEENRSGLQEAIHAEILQGCFRQPFKGQRRRNHAARLYDA